MRFPSAVEWFPHMDAVRVDEMTYPVWVVEQEFRRWKTTDRITLTLADKASVFHMLLTHRVRSACKQVCPT